VIFDIFLLAQLRGRWIEEGVLQVLCVQLGSGGPHGRARESGHDDDGNGNENVTLVLSMVRSWT
jgi:hypothetical protein